MSHRLLLPLCAALLSGMAFAQDVRLYRQSEAVDPQEVARILDTRPAAGIKMRSLRVLDDKPSAQVMKAEQARSGPEALALPVQFAFGSASIASSARAQLDALAEGIRLLPEGQKVVIEGHTDATGSEHYNDVLSARRAESVRQYLVTAHRIEPDRLKALGRGEHATLPGRDPSAAVNRRVQFRGEQAGE